MKNFTIKVTEHREGLFVVEAEDENDALERLGRIIGTDCYYGGTVSWKWHVKPVYC